MNHFTNIDGYNAIRVTSDWVFKAAQPPGNHPIGAYFTTLVRGTPRKAKRLRVPASKLTHVFEFHDAGDLIPLAGGRGRFIFYSPIDYTVTMDRQVYSGPT